MALRFYHPEAKAFLTASTNPTKAKNPPYLRRMLNQDTSDTLNHSAKSVWYFEVRSFLPPAAVRSPERSSRAYRRVGRFRGTNNGRRRRRFFARGRAVAAISCAARPARKRKRTSPDTSSTSLLSSHPRRAWFTLCCRCSPSRGHGTRRRAAVRSCRVAIASRAPLAGILIRFDDSLGRARRRVAVPESDQGRRGLLGFGDAHPPPRDRHVPRRQPAGAFVAFSVESRLSQSAEQPAVVARDAHDETHRRAPSDPPPPPPLERSDVHTAAMVWRRPRSPPPPPPPFRATSETAARFARRIVPRYLIVVVAPSAFFAFHSFWVVPRPF